MALRDLVSRCGEESRGANPVLKLIDQMTGDKSQAMTPNLKNFNGLSKFEEDEMNYEFERGLNHQKDQRSQISHGPLGFIVLPKPDSKKEDFFKTFTRKLESEEREYDEMDKYFHKAPPEPLAQHPMEAPLVQKNNDSFAREFSEFQDFKVLDNYYNECSDPNNLSTLENDFLEEVKKEGTEIFTEDGLKKARELKRVAQEFEKVQDIKFSQSKFFSMMNSISNGEITFKGAQMVPAPAELKSDESNVLASDDSIAQEFKDYVNQENPPIMNGTIMDNEITDAFREYENNLSLGNDLKMQKEIEEEFKSYYKQNNLDEKDFFDEFEKFGQYEDISLHYEDTDYHFTVDNPFIGNPNNFELGMKFFKEGQTTEAMLAFEAVVQENPKNYLCWELLGQTQAENDQDGAACAAFNKVLEDPKSESRVLLPLSVSYTNECKQAKSLYCIHRWLRLHSEYSHFAKDYSTTIPIVDSVSQVINMFLEAVRASPTVPDPDVQVALGLLYNLVYQYEKVLDCFKTAARLRPNDHLIWNKLGATMANSDKNEQAIECYIKTLEIKPTYVRALCNIGVSMLALKDYERAAKAFLRALSISPYADHRWSNLCQCFVYMERSDLVEKCAQKNVNLFKNEFDF